MFIFTPVMCLSINIFPFVHMLYRTFDRLSLPPLCLLITANIPPHFHHSSRKFITKRMRYLLQIEALKNWRTK